MPRRCLYPVVVGLLLALSTNVAQASDQRRIGIVVSVVVNISPEDASKLADQLGNALRRERPVDVIAGDETTRRMPSGGLPDECVANPTCRNDIGRRLDADELLMLVIVKQGDRIQIDATWANVASGKVASRPRVVIEAESDRDLAFTKAIPRLLPHIKKATTKKGPDIVIVTPGSAQPSAGRSMTTPGWIATGIAAASLIGGGVFALAAQQKYSSLDDDGCRDRLCDAGELDSLRTRARTADVLFGVAAGATVTALVLYLRSGGTVKREQKNPAPVRVGVGAGGAGVTIGGTF